MLYCAKSSYLHNVKKYCLTIFLKKFKATKDYKKIFNLNLVDAQTYVQRSKRKLCTQFLRF